MIGIEPRVLEYRLVPVEHDGGALERNAPDMPIDLTVLQESGIEAPQPGSIRIRAGNAVERYDQFIINQRKHVSRKQHRELRACTAVSAVCAFVKVSWYVPE